MVPFISKVSGETVEKEIRELVGSKAYLGIWLFNSFMTRASNIRVLDISRYYNSGSLEGFELSGDFIDKNHHICELSLAVSRHHMRMDFKGNDLKNRWAGVCIENHYLKFYCYETEAGRNARELIEEIITPPILL